ncbi:MAG: hypothetical protein AB2L14_27440 [Candidatus Xenobiia bacterium LiM19]
MTEYICGVSLGAHNQNTALVILERITELDNQGYEKTATVYHLRKAERFLPGTLYPVIAESLAAVYTKMRENNGSRTMAVDKTGVGGAVIELMEQQKIHFDAQVTITNGNTVSKEEHKNNWFVPKRDLVSVLQVLLQSGRLKIAEGIPDVAIISQELQNFKIDGVKLKPDANSFEESWREKDNDDYVFAAAVAAWSGETRSRPRVRMT